jgi:uncharacterized membrane protein
VWPGENVGQKLSRDINSAFILGRERTLEQDVEYAISQLSEIAVRALSSGVNDPITAMTCIDWLGDCLSRLARRKMPSSHRYDENNRLRIICKPFTYAGMVNEAFDMIRQNSKSVAAVSIRLLETIATVAGQVTREKDRAALIRQAAMVKKGCHSEMFTEEDQKDLQRRFEAVSRVVDRKD